MKPQRNKSHGFKSHDLLLLITTEENESVVKFFTKKCNCDPRNVTGITVLLEPHFLNLDLIQIRPKKIGNHVWIMISIHCFCIYMLIFKTVWAEHPICPKATPNGYSLWVHLFFLDYPWVLISPNSTILFTDIST